MRQAVYAYSVDRLQLATSPFVESADRAEWLTHLERAREFQFQQYQKEKGPRSPKVSAGFEKDIELTRSGADIEV